jgi:hypothetical protein
MMVIGHCFSMQLQTRQQKHRRPLWLRTHCSIRQHLRSRVPAPVQWRRPRLQHGLHGSRPRRQHSRLQNSMLITAVQNASRDPPLSQESHIQVMQATLQLIGHMLDSW